MRVALALGAGMMFGLFVAAGCEDQSVKLGPPNGLEGKTIKDEPSSSGDGGSSGSSGGCVPPGDAAACPTFTGSIYPQLMTGWGCNAPTASCHGTGGQAPLMVGTADAVYTTLTQYKGGNSKPYVNPKCTELTESSFDCDLVGGQAKCATGSQMPSGLVAVDGGGQSHNPLPGEIQTLEAWIKCGAPK